MARAARKVVHGCGGRPVPPTNLHATLAFLGWVGEARMPAVLGAADAARAGQFLLHFRELAYWPRPQVLAAVAPQLPPAAQDLAAALYGQLTGAGFRLDARPWRAHVTLARKVSRPLAELVLPAVDWPVTDLSLVESVTDPAGACYQVLWRWPLAAPGSPPEPPAAAD